MEKDARRNQQEGCSDMFLDRNPISVAASYLSLVHFASMLRLLALPGKNTLKKHGTTILDFIEARP